MQADSLIGLTVSSALNRMRVSIDSALVFDEPPGKFRGIIFQRGSETITLYTDSLIFDVSRRVSPQRFWDANILRVTRQ